MGGTVGPAGLADKGVMRTATGGCRLPPRLWIRPLPSREALLGCLNMCPAAGNRPDAPAEEDRADLTSAVRALARMSRVVDRTSQAAGLSLAQYRLLQFVAREPQRAWELARKAAVRQATLTALVKALESDGLLRRVPVASDRRGIRLEVTPAGRRALRSVERALSDRLEALLHDVADPRAVVEALASLGVALDRDLEQLISNEGR
jgi:DNA-binding MarR family transcriptional regulator